MKKIFSIRPLIWSTLVLALFSCKKENTASGLPNGPTQGNWAAVANAGPDQTVNIASCYVGRTIELDASASLNPGNGLLEFSWTKLSGPFCIISSEGTNSPKAKVTQLYPGQYVFQVTVTGQPTASSKGLSWTDSMRVTVTGTPSPSEYDLDINFNNDFQFSHNTPKCYTFFFMGAPVTVCMFYDITTVRGSFNVPTLGDVIFSAYEEADTAASGGYRNTQMSLSCAGCAPSEYIEGVSSINFKQLMRQGGGPFSGSLSVQTGSASHNCDPHVFDNADPLAISGSMDTAAHTINLTIKGKVFL
jgi:hypothetical protein